MKILKSKKSAQDIQDDIFRKMSPDRRIEIGSQLWQLAKELSGGKINYEYGSDRSKASSGKNSPNS